MQETVTGAGADSGLKEYEADLSQGEVGRHRNAPGNRAGALFTTEEQAGDQGTAGEAQAEQTAAGERERDEAEDDAHHHAESD